MRSLFAALALLWGCASAPHVLPPVPGAGGPAWKELTTEHFVLWTDLPVDNATRALRHFEDFRAVMIAMLFHGVESLPPRSLVIAISHWDDWAIFGNNNVLGFFVRADHSVFRAPFLVYEAEKHEEHGYQRLGPVEMYWEKNADPTQTVQHELGHLVMETMFYDAPPWLQEGVAQYLETARLDDDKGTAEIGSLPEDLVKMMRGGAATVGEVLRLRTNPQTQRFYVTSRILVSYLLNREPKPFSAYQRALKVAPPERRDVIWESVFPESLAQMETKIVDWLQRGKHTILHFNWRPRSIEPRMRNLTDADVYACRALLFAVLGRENKRDAALENARAAVAADPTHVVANVMLFALGAGNEVRAEEVAKAHPDDYRAWLLVASSLDAGAPRDEAVHKVCELAANEDSLVDMMCTEASSGARRSGNQGQPEANQGVTVCTSAVDCPGAQLCKDGKCVDQ